MMEAKSNTTTAIPTPAINPATFLPNSNEKSKYFT